jgi:hypothetical protein
VSVIQKLDVPESQQVGAVLLGTVAEELRLTARACRGGSAPRLGRILSEDAGLRRPNG